MKIELSRRIRSDIESVWKGVTDPQLLASWQPTLRSVQVVSGSRHEPGGVSELVYDENGREVRLEEIVQAAERPRLLALSYRGEQAVTVVRHVFDSPSDGETRWTVVCRFRFRGLLPRLLGLFMKGSIRRRVDADMARLQDLLERHGERSR